MEIVRMRKLDKTQFKIVIERLDIITRLLALAIIKDKKNVAEQIEVLTRAGFRAKEISEILGRTENQIYVTQTALRKKKNKTETSDNITEVKTDG